MSLFYDDASHRYILMTDGGEQLLPSVSQILQKSGMYGYPRTASSHEKMNFGTHVHKLAELIDDKIVTAKELDSPEIGHLTAYEQFKEDVGLEIIASEAPIYHSLYLYGAKPDRVAITKKLDGKPKIIEIKTGLPHPANMLQLSAYHEAQNSMPFDLKVDGSLAVYLSANGTYKLVTNQDHERNFSLFLSCIQIMRWKDKHGIGKDRSYGAG
jgi:hypothetical protein